MKKMITSLIFTSILGTSIANAAALKIELDKEYYISASRLNLRSSEDSSANNILGKLLRNDKVLIVSFGENQSDDMVEVEIIKTKVSNIKESKKIFVSKKFLLDTKSTRAKFSGKYFVIQNIATERYRVYKRECRDNTCPHKMVLEIEMVAGENTEGRRTRMGSYRITSWRKFYQDHKALYPSWYNKDYPMPPADKKGVLSWLKKKYMPVVNGERKGEMRGAFGWYAGFVGPNSDAQWMHGTIGWGEKSKKFVKRTKKFFANLISNPRSHGCSRVDNQAIAYLKHILPVGTPLVKVYAKEALLNSNLTRYGQTSKLWDYILTTNPGIGSDKNYVLSKNIPNQNILEEGTYEMDTFPNIVKYKKAGRARNKSGKTGNIYDVKDEIFANTGTFYVDAGMFSNYKHPLSPNILLGGYDNEVIPEFMNITSLK